MWIIDNNIFYLENWTKGLIGGRGLDFLLRVRSLAGENPALVLLKDTNDLFAFFKWFVNFFVTANAKPFFMRMQMIIHLIFCFQHFSTFFTSKRVDFVDSVKMFFARIISVWMIFHMQYTDIQTWWVIKIIFVLV